jgi:hypothetical protein
MLEIRFVFSLAPSPPKLRSVSVVGAAGGREVA